MFGLEVDSTARCMGRKMCSSCWLVCDSVIYVRSSVVAVAVVCARMTLLSRVCLLLAG